MEGNESSAKQLSILNSDSNVYMSDASGKVIVATSTGKAIINWNGVQDDHNRVQDGHSKIVIEREKRPKATKVQKGVILGACMFLNFTSTGFLYGLGVLYVDIIRTMNTSSAEAALIQSVTRGVLNGAGLIYGILLNRFDTISCIIVGTFLSTVGFVGSAFVDNIVALILVMALLTGVGGGLVYLASIVLVSSMFESKSGLAVSFANFGSGIAQFVIPYLFEVLTQLYEWRGTLFLYGAIVLNNFVVVLLIRIFLPISKQSQKKGTSIKEVFNFEVFRILKFDLYLPCIVLLGISVLMESWFLVDTMVQKGYTREDGSLLLTLLGVGGLFGRLIVWPLHEKIRCSGMVHISVLCVLMAICHMLIAFFDDYWSLFGTSLVFGVLLGIYSGFGFIVLVELVGLEYYSMAQGMNNTLFGGFNAVGGAIGGAINDVTGSYDQVYYLAAACQIGVTMICIFIMVLFSRRHQTFKIRN